MLTGQHYWLLICTPVAHNRNNLINGHLVAHNQFLSWLHHMIHVEHSKSYLMTLESHKLEYSWFSPKLLPLLARLFSAYVTLASCHWLTLGQPAFKPGSHKVMKKNTNITTGIEPATLPPLQGTVVERMSARCGGFLRYLSLKDCKIVEDAALEWVYCIQSV